MKVIIDCDVGVDDAFAIMLASLMENVEILAITVVHGNSNIQNCYNNTKLVLNKLYANRKLNKQPQVYIGASKPFLSHWHIEEPYFGADGLCGKAHTLYKNEIEDIRRTFPQNLKQEEHASFKIFQLVNEFPGEISIICLGPLTNLALAIRLSHNPEFFSMKIKKLIIMGGDEPIVDNKHIEANFAIDPISAKIVIEDYKCPILISTFQFTIRNFNNSVDLQKLKTLFEEYSSESSTCQFMQSIGIITNEKNQVKDYISCDYTTMLISLKDEESELVCRQYKSCDVDVTNDKGLIKVSDIVVKSQNIKFAIGMNQEILFKYLEYCIKKMSDIDFQRKNLN